MRMLIAYLKKALKPLFFMMHSSTISLIHIDLTIRVERLYPKTVNFGTMNDFFVIDGRSHECLFFGGISCCTIRSSS